MSSTPTTYPPLEPGTVIQGLTIEASGTVWWQWLTFFAFGNLFAGYWLVLAFLNAHPDVRYKLHQLFVRLGLRKPAAVKQALSTRVIQPQHTVQPTEQQQQLSVQPSQQAEGGTPQGFTPGAGSQAVALHQLASTRTGGGGDGLTSPLRSHRSRSLKPSEICMEQTITPKGSLPVSPSVGITPRVSTAGTGTPAETAYFSLVEGTEGVGSGAVEVGEDGEGSTYTDGSCTEPRLVQLEWRNLCYAVKASTGLRLIVQVGRQQGVVWAEGGRLGAQAVADVMSG
jgi:hypothetical protein